MPVHTRTNQELEDEGEDELVVAALRYTGSQSVYNAPALRDQGYFPSHGVLQGAPDGPGPWTVALFPSKRLGFFETHQDLEIAYDPATIAEAFLEKNTLPQNIFGANVNQHVQDRVLDKLGLDVLPRDSQAVREELAEVAGDDVDAGEEAEEENFDYDLTRSELQNAAKPFDPDFHIGHAKSTELEEFLLEQDDSKVRSVVQQVQNGEDPALDESETESETETESESDGETDETDGDEGGEN